MKYPDNTPHVKGLWYMPTDDPQESEYVIFHSCEEFKWYEEDEVGTVQPKHIFGRALNQKGWDGSVETYPDGGYFDDRANLILPSQFYEENSL